MSSRLFKIVLIAAALLLFTACEEVTPTPTANATELPTPEMVTCPPDYLAAPVLTGPAPDATVDSLTPFADLELSGRSLSGCKFLDPVHPGTIQVEVLHGPFFRDDLGSVLTGKATSFTTAEHFFPVSNTCGASLDYPEALRAFPCLQALLYR